MDPHPEGASLSPKQQVVERLRQAMNVLVTVRSNPSVDELAATIGMTLMLNKLGKHATAVFSGQVPSTLEFLRPEETIETNTDSLRDFIVSLDKSKADKLRYKVEENVVKIFITPYRTSITEKDLEFTQGDFNVDVVLALGVTQREELDQAITAHGRILHDATVISLTAGQRESSLGALNWQEPAASSLSEMLVSISEAFQGGLIDAQMATAFLTGIVAETERFSNTKTSPKVMTMAAQLMAAGANQQLIANELQKGAPAPLTPPADLSSSSDGSLSIDHNKAQEEPVPDSGMPLPEMPQLSSEPENKPGNFLPPLPPSEAGESFEPLMPAPDSVPAQPAPAEQSSPEPEATNMPEAPPASPEPPAPEVLPIPSEPPASEEPPAPPEAPAPPVEAVLPPPPIIEPEQSSEAPSDDIEIDHEGNLMRTAPSPKHKSVTPLSEQEAAPTDSEPSPMPAVELPQVPRELPPPPPPRPDMAPEVLPDDTTLSAIEESVHSPHLQAQNDARSAVDSAYGQAPFDPANTARSDLNAMPLGGPPAPAGYDVRLPTTPDPNAQTPPPLPGEENQLPPPPIPPPFNPQQ